MKQFLLPVMLLSFCLTGCGQEQPPPSDGRSSLKLKKTATDIAIYNPTKDGEPVDTSKLPRTFRLIWEDLDPAPLIEAYNESNGHYPENYAEFKSGILEPNEITFPEDLPVPLDFRYDEANHRVVLISR